MVGKYRYKLNKVMHEAVLSGISLHDAVFG